MTTDLRRPAPIRFDDLAHPVYPAAAQPIRDGLAAYGAILDLQPDVLLAAATERSGLDNFGDPAFRERLDVLCTALRDEAGLSDTGLAIAFEQLVGNLVNRLRLEALIADHPEIEDIEIARPIIICGLPAPAPPTCTTCSPPTPPFATCRTGRASNRCPAPVRTRRDPVRIAAPRAWRW